ncbi:unnamed protein product, partial [Mesorhabditis belari]|uniref:Zinc finger PHD-type domain-containing protein n=1 Tax=Mesorhabditis belari TaxID=2138241 RepID=A0AAF3EUA4_9BILA
MASCKQLFSSPLTCHSLTYRTAEFLVVDFDKKGQIPSLKFPMNDPEPQIIRITNKHPTEAMCLQVFPPLPRDAWDKPFGHVWSTMTNEWFLELYGWVKGMKIADQVMVACQKYGTPLGHGKKPITPSDFHAMEFAAFCELQASIDDVALQIDAGFVVPVILIEQYIFDVLDKVLQAPEDDDVSSSSLRSNDELNENVSSMSSSLSTASLSLLGNGLIHSTPMVQDTPAKSPIAAVTCQKRRRSGDLFRDSLKTIAEVESASNSDQPGPSNQRIRHKDNNSDEDGALIDFIHTSTSQPRGYENALSDKNQDTHIRKNDGCPKCHKTMYGKACLRCQDGCLKWWHTRCFDTTLHYRADEAKARAHDGKLLCAACRQGI